MRGTRAGVEGRSGRWKMEAGEKEVGVEEGEGSGGGEVYIGGRRRKE